MKLYPPLRGDFPITGEFGPRTPIFVEDFGWTANFHYGRDYAAPEGTPIYAMHDGTVAVSGWDYSGYGGGWEVRLDQGKESTWYLHMAEPSKLRVGDKITAGTFIGYVGNTGASLGAHLHVEHHVNGSAVDPRLSLVNELPPGKAPKMNYISIWRTKNSAGKSSNLNAKPDKGEQRLTSGKVHHLHVNNKQEPTILFGKADINVHGSVHLRGRAGDLFTFGVIRGTWTEKGGWKETAYLESIQGHIDSNGIGKVSLGVANVLPSGERLRFYVLPLTGAAEMIVERYSVKGHIW